jgi:hypothetical protein
VVTKFKNTISDLDSLERAISEGKTVTMTTTCELKNYLAI